LFAGEAHLHRRDLSIKIGHVVARQLSNIFDFYVFIKNFSGFALNLNFAFCKRKEYFLMAGRANLVAGNASQ
jgi:hypothetical protein